MGSITRLKLDTNRKIISKFLCYLGDKPRTKYMISATPPLGPSITCNMSFYYPPRQQSFFCKPSDFVSLSLSHEYCTTCFVLHHNCFSVMINNASFPLSCSFCPSLSMSCLSTCLFCTLTIILANTSHQPIIISQSQCELYVVSIN